MSIAEKIKALRARIAQSEDARNGLMVKSLESDVALTDEQVTEYNGFSKALADDTAELARFLEVERSMAAAAVAVSAVTEKGVAAITVTPNAPKGSSFTRTAMVLAKSKGNVAVAEAMAKTHYPDDNVVQGIMKAAVAAGSTSVAAWAGNLIYPEAYGADFVSLLYPQTVLGRLNLKKVPFNVTIAGQTGGTAVGWVGEAQPKPVTAAAFNRVFLEWCKVGAISVMSDELIRFSNPAAEALVQADLLKATAQGIDATFLGNSAAVANISPAGILNGATTFAATGADAPSLIADIQTLVGPAIAANYDLSSAKLLMSPSRALAIASMRNALGGYFFPNITMDGGQLEGLGVVTSNNVAGSEIILVIQSEIFLSEDAGPQLDISTEASIIMDGAPGSSAAVPTSMFQNGLVAIRIGQFINWQKRRTLCASAITGVAYGSVVSA